MLELTMWLARTQQGTLMMFPEKPFRHPMTSGDIWVCHTSPGIEVPADKNGRERFPEVTYGNSPVSTPITFGNIETEPIDNLQFDFTCNN